MSDIFFTLTIIAMLITLAVLASGLFSMARGGEFNRRNANKIMRLRILAQAVALAMFAAAMLLR
ncbi:twin transmembrane helix small protein [Oceanibaculum nanhaiense]|uniref:twin transmembrane helix small protein n=1 Tax=Oceanibaculum nanhaiense TaxID=1909734 RepID=UPI0025A3494A|nr:twin transmembrane helix small protein [Oceanibaculum nanhaiense]MDM7945659.1 twin transmembrane helix small protein [Oceanibaculum nanhaiense]